MKPQSQYQPQFIKAIPWDKIEEHYSQLIVDHGFEFQNILSLVQYISNTGLSEKLFGYTSLHKLVITIYDTPEWNRESLHVELETATGKVYFTYHSKPFEKVVERCYNEDEIISGFIKYVKMLKW
ncbi:hypothetical protein GCM10023149_17240 [Mucilaginibacter gynuensis]|uniref:DUF5655 domain-containing protein n=1 Tax=Mucilaginibacter gynuensis TaxID=1302236 RepID=A0ABP8G7B1_9SPHI